MMSTPKLVVHTDVLLSYLGGDSHPSVLRIAMTKFFCYTTVFHAIELFSLARTEAAYRAVESAMSAMKLLGLNPKNAPMYGRMLSSAPRMNRWNMLIAGLCRESRLPILTDRRQDFHSAKGLVIVPTKLVRSVTSATDILSAARNS